MKKGIAFLFMLALLISLPCISMADDAGEQAVTQEGQTAAERGLAALQATGRADRIVLPQEASYLSEWKTLYARKAFKAPSLPVESVPKLLTGRQTQPYICEGTEVTVVAEENDMSCIIYRAHNNKQYVGWIQSIRLLEEFPGKEYTSGEMPAGPLRYRDDITVSWSQPGFRWLTTDQSYSILSEEIEDCLGFTFEYQLIMENTPYWDNILGPRKIYVKSHGAWKEVAEFPYPEFGAVKVQVWLDEPTDIEAVGTIAQCRNSEIFRFRQTATDFAFGDGEPERDAA